MNALIRMQVLLASALLMSNLLIAGDGQHSSAMSYQYKSSIVQFYNVSSVLMRPKVCVCQILNLESNNHSLENAALFAERTDDGQSTKGISVATTRLEQEKKHMKNMFYNKIKVVGKVAEATDCETMYKRMKLENATLVFYELLNADIESVK